MGTTLSRSADPRKDNWASNDVGSCKCCRKTFSPVRRRHHCRACGFVVCALCSSRQSKVSGWGDSPQRVCDACSPTESVENLARAPTVDRAFVGERPPFVSWAHADAPEPQEPLFASWAQTSWACHHPAVSASLPGAAPSTQGRRPFVSWALADAPQAHEPLFVSWAQPSWASSAL